jgi:hypothetical protein
LVLFLTLVLFNVNQSHSLDLGKEFIPPDDWTYPVLKRFEALGLVLLPSEQLYTRPEVIGYVEKILANSKENSTTLSERDRFNLDRLQQEYTSSQARENPKSRWDPPVFYGKDPPLFLEADLSFSFIPSTALLDPKWAFFLNTDPQLKLHFRDWVTWDVRYQVTLGPERDDRVDRGKPSRRTKSWSGVTSLYERAYIVYDWQSRLTFFLGRDYTDWGPSENGNLILSDTAGSLDKFGGRIRFKNLTLSFLNGTLSADADRRLAAHRLEMRFGPAVLGFTEAVVYAGRGFDPLYLLPLSSFYSNQFNEQGNEDNALWEFDSKFQIADGLVLFGSLLIDDYQFEPNEPAPNKLAFDVGGRAALMSPLAATFRFQYRYVDIYTYTHMDTATYWIAGHGDPSLDNPLGASQGPDSDTAFLDMAVYPIPSLTTALSFSLQRRGEGNDWRMFEEGDDINPEFPSGVVEKTYGFGLSIEWELKGDSSIGATILQAYVENIAHVPDKNDWTTSMFMHVTWNL